MNSMEEGEPLTETKELPPLQLFERLSYLSGYTWDVSLEPFHSVSRFSHDYTSCRVLKVARAMTTGMSLVSSISVETDPSPTRYQALAPTPPQKPPEEAPPSSVLGRLLVISTPVAKL